MHAFCYRFSPALTCTATHTERHTHVLAHTQIYACTQTRINTTFAMQSKQKSSRAKPAETSSSWVRAHALDPRALVHTCADKHTCAHTQTLSEYLTSTPPSMTHRLTFAPVNSHNQTVCQMWMLGIGTALVAAGAVYMFNRRKQSQR